MTRRNTIIGMFLLTWTAASSHADTIKVGSFPQLIAHRDVPSKGLPKGEIHLLHSAGDHILARFGSSYWEMKANRWESVVPPSDAPKSVAVKGALISQVKTRTGETWVTTTEGAWRSRGRSWVPLDLPRIYKPAQPVPHIDSVLRYVAADESGHVWIATDRGLIATDGADWWHQLNREDGVPYEDILCVTIGPNGDIWAGTTQGAWRLRNGKYTYFWGKRWLPGNKVRSIAVKHNGTAYFATDGGIGVIEERKMTLAAKATHYEEITAKRHNRRGWVTDSSLTVPGNPDGGFTYEASDNDGLWTALYVAAEAYRYSVTKSPEALALARKSMNALLDLTRLSGVPGFPGRAIIQKGERVTGYNPDETVRVAGETDKIWFTSKTHPDLLIKGDTSSDELDGHYFAYQVYFDLVANQSEKNEIAKVVRAITDNLLTHNFRLIGHTGRRTLWGVFGPDALNEDPRWFDERGLNSAELLCYLKVAHHVCGDQRFADAYENLVSKHHYLLNIANYRRRATWNSINHSDDQLAYCVYYPLLTLEKRPDRLAVLKQAVAATWLGSGDTPGIRTEDSPLYNFMYGAIVGGPCDAEAAVTSLRDWPWELVNHSIKNSHRHDVSFRTNRGVAKSDLEKAPSMIERRVMRWNGNPFTPDHNGAGRSEEDGTAFLLPYWMGRYHGIISEDR